MTQRELAQRADLSSLTVHKAERGRSVDISTLSRLAEALEVDRGQLLRREIDVPQTYQSVFLSYGGPDEGFARLLYGVLCGNGVETFFFPESAVPGDRLSRTMSDGVLEYERVVLVCSEASLVRAGVLNELEQVLSREAAEGGAEILIPITIDDFLFSRWSPENKGHIARDIRARVVADFRGATERGDEFDARCRRLLQALEVDEEGDA